MLNQGPLEEGVEQRGRQRLRRTLLWHLNRQEGPRKAAQQTNKQTKKIEKERRVSPLQKTLFLAPQTDAEADGVELTEDGRRRNEKA